MPPRLTLLCVAPTISRPMPTRRAMRREKAERRWRRRRKARLPRVPPFLRPCCRCRSLLGMTAWILRSSHSSRCGRHSSQSAVCLLGCERNWERRFRRLAVTARNADVHRPLLVLCDCRCARACTVGRARARAEVAAMSDRRSLAAAVTPRRRVHSDPRRTARCTAQPAVACIRPRAQLNQSRVSHSIAHCTALHCDAFVQTQIALRQLQCRDERVAALTPALEHQSTAVGAATGSGQRAQCSCATTASSISTSVQQQLRRTPIHSHSASHSPRRSLLCRPSRLSAFLPRAELRGLQRAWNAPDWLQRSATAGGAARGHGASQSQPWRWRRGARHGLTFLFRRLHCGCDRNASCSDDGGNDATRCELCGDTWTQRRHTGRAAATALRRSCAPSAAPSGAAATFSVRERSGSLSDTAPRRLIWAHSLHFERDIGQIGDCPSRFSCVASPLGHGPGPSRSQRRPRERERGEE